jgi:hypothetical protein
VHDKPSQLPAFVHLVRRCAPAGDDERRAPRRAAFLPASVEPWQADPMLPAVRPISAGRIRILPQPWPPRPPEPPRAPDPLRMLTGGGDPLGLDRRAVARGPDAPVVDAEVCDGRLTAATHRPCPVVFGLADRGRWALVKGLSRAPQGLLVQHLDPCDRELDDRDRVGALGLVALGRVAGRCGRPASPLFLVSSCLQASMLVDTLARRIRTGGARDVEIVPLLVRTPSGWRDLGAACRPWRVELAELCDPQTGVLALAVSPSALASLSALLAPPGRAPAAARPPAGRRKRKAPLRPKSAPRERAS